MPNNYASPSHLGAVLCAAQQCDELKQACDILASYFAQKTTDIRLAVWNVQVDGWQAWKLNNGIAWETAQQYKKQVREAVEHLGPIWVTCAAPQTGMLCIEKAGETAVVGLFCGEQTAQAEEQLNTVAAWLAARFAVADKLTAQTVQMLTGLKAPLQVILSAAQMLPQRLDEAASQQAQPLLQFQRRNVYRMLRMLDNAADMLRGEQESLTIELTVCGLRKLAQSCTNLTAEEALPVSVSCTWQTDEAEVFVLCCRTAMQRVLLNLLTNAVFACRAAGKGTVQVSITVGNGNVMLTIADEGCGMSQEELRHIGEPYWRGKDEAERREGSGLGVHVSRRLLAAMNGSLTYTSTPGKGTVATVTMPADVGQSAAHGVFASDAVEYSSDRDAYYVREELAALEAIK